MKFRITTTIISLALANLGFAAPAAGPTAVDQVQEIAPLSANSGLWRRYPFAEEWNGE